MQTLSNVENLAKRIQYLEQKSAIEKDAISSEISNFVVSLKPINIFRSFIHSVKKSPDIKDDILHGIVGLGTGFLTNKLLLGSLHGPLKKVLSVVFQAGITNAAVKYPEAIKEKGLSLLTRFLHSIKIKSDSVDSQHIAGGSNL